MRNCATTFKGVTINIIVGGKIVLCDGQLCLLWHNKTYLKRSSQFNIFSGNPKDNAVDKTNSSISSGDQSASGTEKSNASTTLASTKSPTTTAAQPETNLRSPALKFVKCTPEDATAMKKGIETLFAFPEGAVVHNFYKCTSDNCQHLTSQEQTRLKTSRDRFVHSWLFDKMLNFCHKTEIAWLVYEEGKGMFCYLCKKHNTENQQNKSKVYNATPCIRFKKSAVQEHLATQQHKDAVGAEMLGRVSVFHKEMQERKIVKDDVMFKAFYAAYWLVKEEISNHKFSSLLDLLKLLGLDQMKHFQYSSQGSVREIFLALGSALLENLLEKVKKAGCYGLLTDEVTDVTVMEMLITFIQYFNKETGQAETSFLFIEDVLKNSNSANAETIFTVLTSQLAEFGLEIQKCGSFVSDGASVMTGARGGVATRLKELNPQLISLHCLCHKLALACTDTSSQIEYIRNVELWLRQLWKLFDNSPKRTAMYLKVQINLKSLVLSDKSKKVVTKKIKKACQTRWLSFDAATSAIYEDFNAILQTLRQLKETDAVASGLLSKIDSSKFIGTIYILKEILPVLSNLSKNFQRGQVNFSHIQPSISYTLQKLTEIADSKSPITALKRDIEGRLSISGVNLSTATENQLSNLLLKYVTALKDNIHSRFDDDLPVVSALSIFNPLTLPQPGSGAFKEHGTKKAQTLAKHFFSEPAKQEQLLAEWEKFKFDMDAWKQEIPEEVKESHLETATEWCLKRLISLKTSYSIVFPALTNVAEVCLSMPVSNAWPERGGSALKRIKTRLRNRLSVTMLQSLLMITINGPKVGTSECESLVTAAVEKWQVQKKRRKMPKIRVSSTPVAASTCPQLAQNDVIETADACVQTHPSQADDNVDGELEVQIASAALNLTDDALCQEEADSDYDSDCDVDDVDDALFF